MDIDDETDTSGMNDLLEAARDSVTIENRIEEVGEALIALTGPGQKIHMLHDVMKFNEERELQPRARIGTARHTELDSFIAHVNRYKSEHTTLWADGEKMEMTAVFDYHPAGDDVTKAAWGRHRAIYGCVKAPEWAAWRGHDDIIMTSENFAEWLDHHIDNIVGGDDYPSPIELLEVARDLQIYTKGTFKRKIDPATGEYLIMVSKEEHTEESTKIPRKACLGLRVFEGGDQYKVEMRIIFRLQDGAPRFSYDLLRADEVERDAFAEVRKMAEEKTELPLFVGTCEQ